MRPWQQVLMFFARTQREHTWKSPQYRFTRQQREAWAALVREATRTAAAEDAEEAEEGEETDEEVDNEVEEEMEIDEVNETDRAAPDQSAVSDTPEMLTTL
jgi:hypothetical protein